MKYLLWFILDLIFLAIFNAVFFIAGGFSHSVSVWISYGFIHFAYLMMLLTPILVNKGKSKAIFGLSLHSISVAYFLVAFVTGVVFILISPESFKTPLLFQLCVAGAYGVVLISFMIANYHTAESEEKRGYQIEYIKNSSAKLKGLIEKTDDKEIKKVVEKAYDALYSSPVKSHHSLTQMENNIFQTVNKLDSMVSSGNKEEIISLADSLLVAINERNQYAQRGR